MRTRDGRVVTGVNLDAYVGRGAVCAEAICIGTALTRKVIKASTPSWRSVIPNPASRVASWWCSHAAPAAN